jgi:hypothetical protein
MTPSRLAELRELEKARTKGPWTADVRIEEADHTSDIAFASGPVCEDVKYIHSETRVNWPTSVQADHDAAFLSAIVNAAPALLDLWSAAITLCTFLDDDIGMDKTELTMLRAALAKLEGPK